MKQIRDYCIAPYEVVRGIAIETLNQGGWILRVRSVVE